MASQTESQRITMITLGCRANQAETDWIRQCAGAIGYTDQVAGEAATLVVINTCTVTGESDRQARQAIRRAIRDHPGARVVVTGCYAQRDPGAVAAIPGVDLVLGNNGKARFQELLHQPLHGIMVDEPEPVPHPPLVATTWPADPLDRARGYLHVQNGCDEQCTFCLIPQLRGKSRSIPLAEAVSHAIRLLGTGLRELVLTGINLGAYGRDLPAPVTLATLVHGLAELPGLARLRLSSLDPADLGDDLLACFVSYPNLSGHLHLSIQSGDDLILTRMHRRHRRDTLLQRLAAWREVRPELVVGADCIVGFPTESDQAFLQTMTLVEQADIALLHVFRYSDRPGSAASRIPSQFRVSDATIRRRSEQLRQAGQEILQRTLGRRVGREEQILLEYVDGNTGFGKTDAFLPVRIAQVDPAWIGQLLPVLILGIDPEKPQLLAEILRKSP